MRITAKQAYVLNNLHRISFIQVPRAQRAMLDGKDCRHQLISLAARQLIRWKGTGRPVKIAEPDGVTAQVGLVRPQVAAE